MAPSHEYVTEEYNEFLDDDSDYDSFKIDRCKKCKRLRTQLELKTGEWVVFNAAQEPTCEGEQE